MEEKKYYYQNYDLKSITYKDEFGVFKLEEWLPIPDYPKYEISDLGRAKSLNYNKTKRPRILRQAITSKGYLNFRPFNEFGNKTYMTHVCVAVTFLGHIPCGTLTVVDHIDNDRLNNMKTNFRMVTTRVNSNRKHLKSSSKFTGVSALPNGKWRAIIVFEGKNINLGCYKTEIEASNVYEKEFDNIVNGRPIEYKARIPSSKYKGVSLDKRYGKWKAEVKINKKTYYLGMFEKETDAHNACQQKYNEKSQSL